MTDAALIQAVERLTGEVVRLRGDMAKLLDRIEEYEDEEVRVAPVLKDTLRAPKTAQEAIAQIDHARRVIRAIEIDIGAIRAKVDNIASNPESRKVFASEALKDANRSTAEREFEQLTAKRST